MRDERKTKERERKKKDAGNRKLKKEKLGEYKEEDTVFVVFKPCKKQIAKSVRK